MPVLPSVPLELWQLLLNSGVGGLALVLLIIFIPFLCGIFWLIFRQQNALTTTIVDSVVGGMHEITEELKGVNEQLQVQTHILTNAYLLDPKRNKIVQLTRVPSNDVFDSGEKDTAS